MLLEEKIPVDIVRILEACSFDTEDSLLSINEEILAEIEQYANEDRTVLNNTSYEQVNNFKFKPGHKVFIMNLPRRIRQLNEKKSNELAKMLHFPQILKTFVETAQCNLGKHPNARRYNETNRFFSTFIYLMCGKACYETLSANLPIPQAQTIRESKSTFHFEMIY